ncbi:MAG: hypothetical protein HUJ26_10810 [Planctomycetaceae bacterium]|nr:hypothetical protein [Planctomycetaceae bacterium]
MPLGRLSIGSGNKCWLQLGGPDIPEIHSWMEVGQKEIALYVFEEEPSIQVNGSKVQFALLKGGETLQIGPFEFQLHTQIQDDSDKTWLKPHLSPQQLENLKQELEAQAPVDEVEKMSAEELVDALEREMHTLEQHDARERTGMNRLLEAVRETQEELGIKRTASVDEKPILPIPELNNVAVSDDFIARIEEVTRSLRDRTAMLESEETGYARAAESLLRTQQRLIEQMDQLISALDESPRSEVENDDDSPQTAIAG